MTPINEARRNAVDKFIQAIPENVYDPCPCGCGMKWRFASKENLDMHVEQFITNCGGE